MQSREYVLYLMFENSNEENIFDVDRAESKECIEYLRHGKKRIYSMIKK
jgi:hypothetical protein